MTNQTPEDKPWVDGEIAAIYEGFVDMHTAFRGFDRSPERTHAIDYLEAIGEYAVERYQHRDVSRAKEGVRRAVSKACERFYEMPHENGPEFFIIVDETSQEVGNPPYRPKPEK